MFYRVVRIRGKHKHYMHTTAFDAVYASASFQDKYSFSNCVFTELHEVKKFLNHRVVPKFGLDGFMIEEYYDTKWHVVHHCMDDMITDLIAI